MCRRELEATSSLAATTTNHASEQASALACVRATLNAMRVLACVRRCVLEIANTHAADGICASERATCTQRRRKKQQHNCDTQSVRFCVCVCVSICNGMRTAHRYHACARNTYAHNPPHKTASFSCRANACNGIATICTHELHICAHLRTPTSISIKCVSRARARTNTRHRTTVIIIMHRRCVLLCGRHSILYPSTDVYTTQRAPEIQTHNIQFRLHRIRTNPLLCEFY